MCADHDVVLMCGQVSDVMEKFERQFENLDVASDLMDTVRLRHVCCFA